MVGRNPPAEWRGFGLQLLLATLSIYQQVVGPLVRADSVLNPQPLERSDGSGGGGFRGDDAFRLELSPEFGGSDCAGGGNVLAHRIGVLRP